MGESGELRLPTYAVSEMDADYSGLDIDRHRTPPVYYTDSGWVFVGSGRQHAVVLRISRPAKPVVAPGRAAPVVIPPLRTAIQNLPGLPEGMRRLSTSWVLISDHGGR